MSKDVFQKDYSVYYDLIYKNKDYSNESSYIFEIVKKELPNQKISILELGCGTGQHAMYWLDKIDHWTGVDQSQEMISICKENLKQFEGKTSYVVSDISNLDKKRSYNAIISLFHVASYMASNDSLEKFFEIASSALQSNGLFIFDFWHGPAVMLDKPKNKILKLTSGEKEIIRITNPEFLPMENIVKVNFEILIKDSNLKSLYTINETHLMRFIFVQEIKFLAKKYNFKVEFINKWLSDKSVTEHDWYGVCGLRKTNS